MNWIGFDKKRKDIIHTIEDLHNALTNYPKYADSPRLGKIPCVVLKNTYNDEFGNVAFDLTIFQYKLPKEPLDWAIDKSTGKDVYIKRYNLTE